MKKTAIIKLDDPKNHFGNIVDFLDNPEKPVHVYKNLHTGLWSIRQNGIVKLHTDYICLRDVSYRVQPAGREKVRREKKKTVHAFICGIVCNPSEAPIAGYTPVYYNPYKVDSFVDSDTREPRYSSQFVDMCVDSRDPVIAIPGRF